MYSLYSRKITAASVWASYILGVGITVSNMFLKFIKSPINAGAAAMIIGLIAVPIVSAVTRKPEDAFLNDLFSSYEQKVTVRRAHSLEDED